MSQFKDLSLFARSCFFQNGRNLDEHTRRRNRIRHPVPHPHPRPRPLHPHPRPLHLLQGRMRNQVRKACSVLSLMS